MDIAPDLLGSHNIHRLPRGLPHPLPLGLNPGAIGMSPAGRYRDSWGGGGLGGNSPAGRMLSRSQDSDHKGEVSHLGKESAWIRVWNPGRSREEIG